MKAKPEHPNLHDLLSDLAELLAQCLPDAEDPTGTFIDIA